MPKTARVFISYARRDGEAFATRLRQRLEREEPEITVWQDRSQMEGGVGWWKQITDALDSVSFLVLVMTPAALESETSQKEWRYARQAGVCVYPVKGVPDSQLNYSLMPPWMREDHFFDLDVEWETFVRYLKSPCDGRRVPFMAPDLPSGFIERRELAEQMIASMLDPARRSTRPGVTVLYGSGGLGKTTLAAGVCHNEDVITAFTGGVLWTTLGEKPDVLTGLTEVFAALTGQRPNFVSVEDGAIEVARRLENQNCLLVLDDVWNSTHVKPFLRGGSKCVRLITTRQFEIATEFGGTERCIRATQMERDEAVQMLMAGIASAEDELAGFTALARRMGQWPLMLKLVRGALKQRLARGDSLPGALRYVNQALDRRGFTVFDQPGQDRHSGFANTIQISLDLLSTGDRQHCFELAIFPGDIDIPLDAAASAWGEDDFTSERLAERLDGLSLLEFNLKHGTLRLHDLMREYFASALGDAAAIHQRLIAGWGDLRGLTNAYAWRWCIYHLAKAGQSAGAANLLTDFDWLSRKLSHSGVNAVIEDYKFVPKDDELRLIQSTVRLAAHVVHEDASQFAGQLLGRLSADGPQTRRLLEGAAAYAAGVWLRPMCVSLTRPGGPILRLLSGHEGPVRDVAVSADGRRIASGSSVKDEVRVWDVESWSGLCVLTGHRSAVNAVDISADGRIVLSGSDDKTARVWNAETGEAVFTLSGHTAAIRAVALTTDGARAVTGSFDGRIIIWDLTTGLPALTLSGHEDWIRAVAVSNDCRWIVSSSMDGTFRVWSAMDGSLIRTLRPHTTPARSQAWISRTDHLLSGADDGSLKIWSLEGSEVFTLCEPGPAIHSVSVSGDGSRAVSLSDEGVCLWDLESKRRLATFSNAAGTPNTAAISPDGTWAVTGSHDENLRIWDLAYSGHGSSVHGHCGWVNAVAVGGNAHRGVSASYDGSLKVWDSDTGAEICSMALSDGAMRGVAIAGDVIVSASGHGPLRVWDADGKPLRASSESIAMNAVALDGAGKLAVSGSPDGQLRIWEVTSCHPVHTVRAHAASILAVAMNREGTMALSASADRTVRCWDTASGALLHTLSGHQDFVRCVSIAAGSGRTIAGSAGGRLKVWDIAAGIELSAIESDVGTFNDVALTAEGRYFITATSDHTVRLWDLDRAQPIATFTADDVVTACAIGDDGRTIIAGDASGAVHFLRIEQMPG